jgi:hypothetical protein
LLPSANDAPCAASHLLNSDTFIVLPQVKQMRHGAIPLETPPMDRWGGYSVDRRSDQRFESTGTGIASRRRKL